MIKLNYRHRPIIHLVSRRGWFVFALLLAWGAAGTIPAEALSFGKNKLHTRDMQWQVFETEHFEIHYYPEEKALAQEVCQLAEAAYAHNTHLFRYKPQEKTPLFIYRNQIDFQQTNILPHVIGVGTGGFTEAYKNRIALPAPPSPEELRRVIFHEYVHALQFNILYGEGLRSFRVYKGYLVPLWVIEGMAEYAAQNWDSSDDMIVRDAVLNDRLIPLTLMDGFSHLEDVYLAYKESQLAMRYLAEQYGESRLASVFKKFKSQISISQILRETIGIGLQEFNRDFLAWVNEKYWNQVYGRKTAEEYGQRLEAAPNGRMSLYTGPAWSPDGRFLAFFSDRDQTMRVYLKARGVARPAYSITSRQFEQVNLQGQALTWSPDNQQLAFVAREEGKNSLYLLHVQTRVLERMDLPCDDFYSPAWAPDGQRIALVGVRNGVSDIYLWHLSQRTLLPVTQDRWADNTPLWSRDGNSLIYASERSNLWQLMWLALNSETSAVPITLTDDPAHHRAPVLSADGNHVFYISDRNGISNVYKQDLSTGAVLQLTDIRSGIVTMALTPDDKNMAFCSWENGNQEITLVNAQTLKPVQETALARSETVLPKPEDSQPSLEEGEEEALGQTTTARAAEIINAYPYQFRFSPDLIFLLAGYDSSQGAVGGGYLTASDYLGDHQLSFVSDFVPGYQMRTILSYVNSTYPVNIVLSGSYRRNYYRYIDLETSATLDEFNDQETIGAVGLTKPFSVFDRVETECALQVLQREREEYTQYRRVTRLRLSLIHDSTRWLDFNPSQGLRHNLSVIYADRLLGGEENYTLLQFDSQAYQTLDFASPHAVLGARLLAVASVGPEHPLFLYGGIGLLPESATLRGYAYGELIGSQMATLTLELRFPLARNLDYTLWPLDFLLWKHFQVVLYDDIGLVGNNLLESNSDQIRNSMGIGFRLFTFLLGKELLTIRLDIAQRTDANADPVYTWGIGQSF